MLLEIELYPLKLYSPIFKTHLCSYKTLLITKLIIKENKGKRKENNVTARGQHRIRLVTSN